MGTRSDMGIALRNEAIDFIKCESMNAWSYLNCLATTHKVADEGELFIFEDVGWYRTHPWVSSICSVLQKLDDAHIGESQDPGHEYYMVIEACEEYPESTELDCGEWHDNTFNLSKTTNVYLSYKE